MQTTPKTSSNSYKIINEEDANRLGVQSFRIATIPLMFLFGSGIIVLLARRFKVRKFLANPLVNRNRIQQSTPLWSKIVANFLMLTSLGLSFQQFVVLHTEKSNLYIKHQDAIEAFMREKLNAETKKFINRMPRTDMFEWVPL